MYVPGTVLLWMAFLLGLGSTIAYSLSIRDPEKWRSMAGAIENAVFEHRPPILGCGGQWARAGRKSAREWN